MSTGLKHFTRRHIAALIAFMLPSMLLCQQLSPNSYCPDAEKEDAFFNSSGSFILIDTDISETGFSLGSRDSPLATFNPYHVKILAPTACNVTSGVAQKSNGCPVVLFHVGIPSGLGQMDTRRYDLLFSHVARHGAIIVAVDSSTPASQKFSLYPSQLKPVFNFILTNSLEAELVTRGFVGSVNVNKILLASHGVGARVLLESLTKEKCFQNRVGGIVLLDPVEEPPIEFALNTLGTIIPANLESNVPWILPALHIMTEFGEKVNSPAYQTACCPPGVSNFHFYDRWRGPIFHSEAADMGHMEVADINEQFNEKEFCVRTDLSDPLFRAECLREAVAGHILHFINFLFNRDGTSSRFFFPKRPEDVKETINGLGFRRRFANAEAAGNTFLAVEPGCEFDADLFDPVTRIVLITVGVFAIVAAVGISIMLYNRMNKTKQEGEELEKLAENMQHYSIVPGMGHVKIPKKALSVEKDAVSEFPNRASSVKKLSTTIDDVESVFPDDKEKVRKIVSSAFVQNVQSNEFPEMRASRIVSDNEIVPFSVDEGTEEAQAATQAKNDEPVPEF